MAMMAMGRAIASPRRRSFSEAVAKVSLTSTLPPTRTSGASSSWARSSTSLATASSSSSSRSPARVTTTSAARPSVGPEGVGAGRPGIGDVEHAVERGDRREAGGEVALDLRVVDVDVVGDDGDLAAGLGQVVELLGDPARLGGGAGAEVGRQHRERRAADGGGHEQQRDPREDDGAPAAHHEASEAAHHAAARSLERRRGHGDGPVGPIARGVQDAGERADGQGAGRAEDGVLAVGVDDHLRGDQPAAGPEHRVWRRPTGPGRPGASGRTAPGPGRRRRR